MLILTVDNCIIVKTKNKRLLYTFYKVVKISEKQSFLSVIFVRNQHKKL